MESITATGKLLVGAVGYVLISDAGRVTHFLYDSPKLVEKSGKRVRVTGDIFGYGIMKKPKLRVTTVEELCTQ